MRTFEKTHPWLKFELDLRKIEFKLWILSGEIKSRCEYIATTPLLPETAALLNKIYLAKGIQGTTAIEGNTLTEEEVLHRIDKTLKLPPSKEYLGIEIDNILKAAEFITTNIIYHQQPTLDLNLIQEYNRLVLTNTNLSEDVVPGEIRKVSVGVGRYRGAPAEDCQYLLNQLCKWLQSSFGQLETEKIIVGVLKAIIGHIYFELIHPFVDGNGRTGRLIEFHLLLASGVPSVSAHLLSNFYNQTRSEYYKQLDYISESNGDLTKFISYAIQGFADGLQEQLQHIQTQQSSIIWRDHINLTFKNKTSKSEQRQQALILELSTQDQEIPLEKLLHLTPWIAATYTKHSKKTLSRDLKELSALQLLDLTQTRLRIKRERITSLRSQIATSNF